MGNIVNLPNISPEAIENLSFEVDSKPAGRTSFNKLNYLNTRLNDNETSKQLVIRLLPMDLTTGSPFVKACFHSIKLDSGYRYFLCLQRNSEIDHEKFGNKCPFCEMNSKAYKESEKETDPIKKRNLQRLSLDNRHKDAIIARCIERGKENEGVKFWKFNLSSRNNDPYHQIMDLYTQVRKESASRGIDSNIFDLYNGFDIILTIKKNETNDKDAFTSTTVSISHYSSPLSDDEELMRKWIYDEKKWTDVFVPKPYEYLKLITENRTPWFDKESGKWVDKEEFEKGKSSQEKAINEEIAQAENAIRGYSEAPSYPAQGYDEFRGFQEAQPAPQQGYQQQDFQQFNQVQSYQAPVQQRPASVMDALSLDKEDLPF